MEWKRNMVSKQYKPKIVKFKTKNFGDIEDGTLIDAFLLVADVNIGLLYFPKETKYTCDCLVLARKKEHVKQEYWYDIYKGGENFINIVDFCDTNFKKFLKKLKL